MQIITLTTDTGLQDYYVAAIKGALYKDIPLAHIIDITHSIKPFDIANAAFQVRSCFKDFPNGTIHIIGVDSEPILFGETKSYPTILKFDGHYFICNDNGFFGAFLDDQQFEAMYRFTDVSESPEMLQFTTKNCFVPLAAKISQNIAFESYTEKIDLYKKAFIKKPTIEQYRINGTVIHIDAFGNLITNITKADFNRFGENIPFTIKFLDGVYYIDKISNTYNSVPNGEKVALFNSTNHLEIAINRGINGSTGGAEKMFGMRIDYVVQVIFEPAGSHADFNSLI